MSCFRLITADIDQAFEASQTFESRFSSNSIFKLGRSQSFGRGWHSFTTPVLARALFSFTSVSLVMLGSTVWQIRGIPIGGVNEFCCSGCRSVGGKGNMRNISG